MPNANLYRVFVHEGMCDQGNMYEDMHTHTHTHNESERERAGAREKESALARSRASERETENAPAHKEHTCTDWRNVRPLGSL